MQKNKVLKDIFNSHVFSSFVSLLKFFIFIWYVCVLHTCAHASLPELVISSTMWMLEIKLSLQAW